MSTGQNNQQQKILILAAIPHSLRLDKEIREIEDAIRRANKRDLFDIRTRTAVRARDIRRAIAEEKPQIVHFCGHGLEDGSLLLEDEARHNKSILPEGLASLFQLHAHYVNCVLLNACHSAKTAQAISKYINYAIGMNQPIGDQAAIAFAQGFYDGLGYEPEDDRDVIQRAFEEGKVAIQLEISPSMMTRKLTVVSDEQSVKNPEHLIPVLLKNPKPVAIVRPSGNSGDLGGENDHPIEVQTSPEVLDNQPQKSIVAKIFSFLPNKGNLLKLLGSSLTVTILLMGVRHFGGLQPMELWAFDQLMRLRSSVATEEQDDRLLVVTIDDNDLRYQDNQGLKRQSQVSLSDEALGLLLKKLDSAPTIGLDIFREDNVSDHPNLLEELERNDNFFFVCKASDPEFDKSGIAPPKGKGIPPKNLTLSDVLDDRGGIIRRHLLFLKPPAASECKAQYSLGTMLALNYLDAKDITTEPTPEKHLQVGNVALKPIKAHTSGYQGIDAQGHQILLNYRSLNSPKEIAETVTLQQVLNGKLMPEDLEDKIVLIGVTVSNGEDYWQTPYGNEGGIPGVFIHAHMTSQIVSAVEDNRPLLWVWSRQNEVLWVWFWSLVGGAIACCSLRTRSLIIAESTAVGILVVVCFGIFTQAGWIPLIPPALAVIITGGVVLAISSNFNRANYR